MNPGSKGSLCLVANTDWYLYNFRVALARELRSIGWEVILVSPPGSFATKFAEEGFLWLEWQLDRQGLNLIRELRSIVSLVNIYRQKRPLLVHHFTIKPVLYGSLAARWLKIPAVVNSITGLGYVYLRAGWQGSALRALVKLLYRLVLKHKSVRVIFENEDDKHFFTQQNLVHRAQATVVEGVGVDLERYQPEPEPEGVPLIVLPARLLWDKGVGVLIEAARLLQQGANNKSIRIALVGTPDLGNPASIEENQLQEWTAEGLVEYWGFREDMSQVYREAHIICLPSLREGLPTVLIEAAAAGRPIVTSDVPGCREVVKHGENGLLVPPGNPAALAEALRTLTDDPALRQKMGVAGRLIAVDRFSNEKIIAATLSIYSDLLKTS